MSNTLNKYFIKKVSKDQQTCGKMFDTIRYRGNARRATEIPLQSQRETKLNPNQNTPEHLTELLHTCTKTCARMFIASPNWE